MTRTRTPLLAPAIAVAAALVIAACSGGSGDAAPTTPAPSESTAPETTVAETTTTTTVPETTTTTLPPIVISIDPDVPRQPLTGEPIADPSEIPDRPALAVKMPNNSQAWPHNGLNRADIVFETIINDNITRFIAVFHDQEVETLGPIRSGRKEDVHIVEAFNTPLFAWSGGNPGVTRLVRNSDLVDLNSGFTSGYYRRSGRSAPHDLFSSTEALWTHSPDDAEPPSVVFPYLRDGDELDGPPANKIEITIDSIDARWEYDAETNRYLRWQEGGPHQTEEYGQVWADNVVVMMLDYQRSSIDGRNPDGQTLGSNPVYVFTGGTVREGVWLRFDPHDPYAFYDNVDDLNEIGLQPGRTWVELPRNGDDVEEVLTWE